MGNLRYTDGERSAIVEMSKSGKSFAEIATMCKEKFGTTRVENSLKLLMHQFETKTGPFVAKTEGVPAVETAPKAKKVTKSSATVEKTAPTLPVKSAKSIKKSTVEAVKTTEPTVA